jgi:hypothetical protein
MIEKPPPRRWFRYSLRTMFVLVTLLCCWLGYELNQVRNHKLIAAKITAAGGEFLFTGQQTWRSRYLGDVEPSSLNFQSGFAESHYDLLVQAKKYFPNIGFIETWEDEYGRGGRLYSGKDDDFF